MWLECVTPSSKQGSCPSTQPRDGTAWACLISPEDTLAWMSAGTQCEVKAHVCYKGFSNCDFCNDGFMGREAAQMPFDADEVLSCLQQTGQASCVLCPRTIYSISSVPDIDGGCLLESCSHLACRDCILGSCKNKSCTWDGDTGSSIKGILKSMREVGFYMIHGSLLLNERRRILDGFRSAGNPHIPLMTLGTGAVG